MKYKLSFTMFIVIAHGAYANVPLVLRPRPQNASSEEMAAYIAAAKGAKHYFLLMRLIQEVVSLDANQDSPLVQLNNALNGGGDVNDDMINAALQYIESWVAEQDDSLPAYQAARINRMLDMVSAMINSDFLKSQNIESSLRARPCMLKE